MEVGGPHGYTVSGWSPPALVGNPRMETATTDRSRGLAALSTEPRTPDSQQPGEVRPAWLTLIIQPRQETQSGQGSPGNRNRHPDAALEVSTSLSGGGLFHIRLHRQHLVTSNQLGKALGLVSPPLLPTDFCICLQAPHPRRPAPPVLPAPAFPCSMPPRMLQLQIQLSTCWKLMPRRAPAQAEHMHCKMSA